MGLSSRQRKTAVERRRHALELHLEGVPYEDIARQAGYTDKSAARKAVEKAIAESAVRDRRRKALQLLLAGVDLATIADQAGYASATAAETDIDTAIAESNAREQATTDALRRDEVMRYNRLQAAFWTKAVKEKDVKAAHIVLKCIHGRERLQGLLAPLRVNIDAQRLGDEILALMDLSDDDGDDG
jgi:MoxR-like ATPase